MNIGKLITIAKIYIIVIPIVMILILANSYYYGLLKKEYVILIIIFSIFLNLIGILLLFIIRSKLQNYSISRVIVQKGKCNDKYLKANDNIFEKDIIATNPSKDSIFIVKFAVEKEIQELKFSVVRKCPHGICEDNADIRNFDKNRSYLLHVRVIPTEMLNFKFNKDLILKNFVVEELYIP